MCCKMEVDLRKTRILASNPVIVITTRNPDGSNNAGAFGSYMRVDNNIIIAIHPESHTFRNIRLRGEFVINVPGLKDMESVMLAGRSWAQTELSLSGTMAIVVYILIFLAMFYMQRKTKLQLRDVNIVR